MASYNSNSLEVLLGLNMITPQTISFAPANVTFGVAPFTVTATASSGLVVSLSSSTQAVCTVAGFTVTIASAGTCTITANQAGNVNYSAATPVMASFTVNSAPQTISFAPLSNVMLPAGPIALSAAASSGLQVTFVSTTLSVCTVSGSSVSPIAAGTCTVQASQPGNTNYLAATNVNQSFTVTQASQTIFFGSLGNVTFGIAPFAVVATASSGLTVAFSSSTLLVCTVTGTTVTIVAVGACSITASQPGNANYSAAATVVQSFTCMQASQTISFTPPGNVVNGIPPFTISATASSGLPVTFASLTLPVCFVSGTTVTILAAGTCTITATQPGNANYAAAAPVTNSFTVIQTMQMIPFNPLGNVSFGVTPFTIGHRQFRASRQPRFDHDPGLHGLRNDGDNSGRRHVLDYSDSARKRHLHRRASGNPEFHCKPDRPGDYLQRARQRLLHPRNSGYRSDLGKQIADTVGDER